VTYCKLLCRFSPNSFEFKWTNILWITPYIFPITDVQQVCFVVSNIYSFICGMPNCRLKARIRQWMCHKMTRHCLCQVHIIRSSVSPGRASVGLQIRRHSSRWSRGRWRLPNPRIAHTSVVHSGALNISRHISNELLTSSFKGDMQRYIIKFMKSSF